MINWYLSNNYVAELMLEQNEVWSGALDSGKEQGNFRMS